MAKGAQQGDGHTAAMVALERERVKLDMERHIATTRPDTRWHVDGAEPRQETATDMALELPRGIISWAENGAHNRAT
eukprot:4512740-Lingulodinium_polyedra.AAC.1